MCFDVWQLPTEKGMSFTTDEDVLGEKAQNQYVLCLWGEWRENDLISYQQQPSRKCCKGQPSSFGQSFFLGGFFFYFIQKQHLLQVNEILRFCDWYIWYASAAVAIPTVPWFENRASSTVWCLSNSRRDVLLRRPSARPKIFNLKFSHY